MRRDPATAPGTSQAGAGAKSRKRATRPEGPEGDLFEELRRVRSELAKVRFVPPYVIFHDAALREIVERLLLNAAELARVSGVGAKKLERYGEGFLAPVMAYLRSRAAASVGADR